VIDGLGSARLAVPGRTSFAECAMPPPPLELRGGLRDIPRIRRSLEEARDDQARVVFKLNTKGADGQPLWRADSSLARPSVRLGAIQPSLANSSNFGLMFRPRNVRVRADHEEYEELTDHFSALIESSSYGSPWCRQRSGTAGH
jgi:hypothetical protein